MGSIVGSRLTNFHHPTAVLSVSLHTGFRLSITPQTQSAPQGGQAIYTATVSGMYDFTEPVMLTVTGLPDGAVVTFFPNPVMPTDTASITITTTPGYVGG